MTAVVAPKYGSHLFLSIKKQNNSHTTPPQTHIAFIVPLPKGIGSRHKSGTWDNEGRQQTNPHDNRCFNINDINSKHWRSEGGSCEDYLWNLPHLASLLDLPGVPSLKSPPGGRDASKLLGPRCWCVFFFRLCC